MFKIQESETAIDGSYNGGAFALAVAGWRWQFGDYAIATGREPALRWLWGGWMCKIKRMPTMRTRQIIMVELVQEVQEVQVGQLQSKQLLGYCNLQTFCNIYCRRDCNQ